MKKLMLLIVAIVSLVSCVVTTKPQPVVITQPKYKRVWYKPWHGPKYYNAHPKKYHKHKHR